MAFVGLSCTHEYFEVKKLEKLKLILDIEEDMQGWDLLTYECPVCKNIHKSYIQG